MTTISWEEALDRALEETSKALRANPETRVESFPVDDVDICGRLCWSDVCSPVDVPDVPIAIVDGYALRSPLQLSTNLENEESFRVVGRSRAGDAEAVSADREPSNASVAYYVTTGARMPMGTDRVVPMEECSAETDGVVKISQDAQKRHPAGTWVRSVGSDASKGSLLVRERQILSYGDVAGLLSCGVYEVKCFSRPIVAVLSTGDELLTASVPPAETRGRAHDSNRPMLLGLLRDPSNGGASTIDLGVARDDPSEIRAKIERALRDESVDVLVTTGGVSAGDRDFLKESIEGLDSSRIIFSRVHVKPGKPVTLAVIPRSNASRRTKPLLIFALPGNPASAFAMGAALVAPCVRVLAGWSRSDALGTTLQVELAHDVVLDVRPELQRAVLETSSSSSRLARAAATGPQRSSRAASLIQAQVLLHLPSATAVSGGVLRRGTVVSATLVRDLRTPTSQTTSSFPSAPAPTAPVASAPRKAPGASKRSAYLKSTNPRTPPSNSDSEASPALDVSNACLILVDAEDIGDPIESRWSSRWRATRRAVDRAALRALLEAALERHDVVIVTPSTSSPASHALGRSVFEEFVPAALRASAMETSIRDRVPEALFDDDRVGLLRLARRRVAVLDLGDARGRPDQVAARCEAALSALM